MAGLVLTRLRDMPSGSDLARPISRPEAGGFSRLAGVVALLALKKSAAGEHRATMALSPGSWP